MEPIFIQYHIRSEQNTEIFDLNLHPQTLELIIDKPEPVPEWARLGFHKCSNCPLDSSSCINCPLAMNIAHVIKRFEHVVSFDRIHLKVVTKERTVSKETTVQRGLSSLMGLIIGASGCPHTLFFKPMARFHLPLASEEETIYRTTSTFLMAHYFLKQRKKGTEYDFNKLADIYNNMGIVNLCVAARIRAASETDSTVNALILLDLYTKTIPAVIEESLEEIRYLFEPFLQGSKYFDGKPESDLI